MKDINFWRITQKNLIFFGENKWFLKRKNFTIDWKNILSQVRNFKKCIIVLLICHKNRFSLNGSFNESMIFLKDDKVCNGDFVFFPNDIVPGNEKNMREDILAVGYLFRKILKKRIFIKKSKNK